ncbi:glycerol-3-phosphate dehydrogenase [Variovorax sp. YR750]|uniref:glycerol-3-phosphate dehydrogenase/oxidase n=1 Tax=Variovorax sp. YR750 TaxID=1884384 RepID=UPI0008B301FD|nr:glycerol-3-phosphate dehydrogenase/oxidase [Variovorax sp. YR750]SEM04966.1 glycerol-3-phosphate dehydrogenase [Variovorax sp. YR750]
MTLKETTRREELLGRLASSTVWDVAIIGGGATGLGVALDAASRGHSVVLVEARDFAKGTSSRATKLLHGGVRYLAQGNVRLVYEALAERAVILRNAPHLAKRLPFVIPAYRRWDRFFYGLGLTAYGFLAGRRSLGRTQWLSAEETLRALPTVRQEGLVGGIRYWDAQFDDARLALALARTAAQQGAVVLNYCAVGDLLHEGGRIAGFACTDQETGKRYDVRARCVVNATGVWADTMRKADAPSGADAFKDRVQPSRGTHLVLDSKFLPSQEALMVPKTSDGRVLFAIPWQGKLLAGTTDVPTPTADADPQATKDEIGFILKELGQFLDPKPTRDDVLSIWAGLRPLVRPDSNETATKKISREHDILVSATGLVTVTGGKWTTYRVIASDTLDACYEHGLLDKSKDCRTEELRLVGATDQLPSGALLRYGAEAGLVQQMPGAHTELCPGLTEAMVRFAARHEFARTVDDVLARRVRLLFLDARLASRCANRVAEILREEVSSDPALSEFQKLATQYARAA